MPEIFNDIEFKVEDAFAAFLADIDDPERVLPRDGDDLKIVLSLETDDLEETHLAVICDELNPDDLARNGNWEAKVRIKTVTSLEEPLPDGIATLRELHRARVGLVRDHVLDTELHTLLTAAAAGALTVQGFQFGKISQRIVGRSWITEFEITLASVTGAAL